MLLLKIILFLGAGVAALVGALAIWGCWVERNRRPKEDGFKYVHVNQDGSARELTEDEQEYLSTEFEPCDGGRPYIKSTYESRDGWGSLLGFIERRKVPASIRIWMIDPKVNTQQPNGLENILSLHRVGDQIVTNEANGTIRCTANPDSKLTPEEQWDAIQRQHGEQQRVREQRVMDTAVRDGQEDGSGPSA